jgi:hypothetical protein
MAATANRRAQWPRILSTNLIELIPSIFRLPRVTLPRRSQIAIRHRSTCFTALSRPLAEPGSAEERTEKFQLCVCSKTCDQHARNTDWR